jgi:hypothetical protein
VPDGVLTNGQKVIGEYLFTVETGNNTDGAGEPAKVYLEDVYWTINVGGAAVADGGGGDDVEIYWASDPGTTVGCDLDSYGGDCNESLAGLAGITSSDTLVIEALDITGAGAAGDYVQTKLMDIDADIYWNDGIGGTVGGVYLPYTDVPGAVFSN